MTRDDRSLRSLGRRTMDETTKKRTLRSVRDLQVYQLAFRMAMRIFELSKAFPPEERYALTDQMRRSARSVCANLAEGWRKRRYRAVFLHKLSDATQEAAETQTWAEFACASHYLTNQTFQELDEAYEHIFAMLRTMESKADAFCNTR